MPKLRHATARELAFDLEKCIGVASATEVGEWVENLVGKTLSAREDQIAEIESNSAGLRVSPSGRPEPESSDSDSDVMMGIPSSAQGTLVGVGAPSGTMPMAQPNRRVAPPAPGQETHSAPPFDMSGGGYGAGATDESTGSKVTGSRDTGTMALPVDRKLPILASGLGLLVLLVIMGVVLLGRGSAETAATSSGASALSASGASTGTGASTSVAAAGATGGTATTADPAPTPSAADTTETSPTTIPTPTTTSTPTTTPAPTAPTHTAVSTHTARPPTPPPQATTAKTAAAPPRRSRRTATRRTRWIRTGARNTSSSACRSRCARCECLGLHGRGSSHVTAAFSAFTSTIARLTSSSESPIESTVRRSASSSPMAAARAVSTAV